MKAPNKKASIIASCFWIISIVLAFKIEPTSNFIWLSDTLLLLGFYPLLISVKSPWLWLIFGILDTLAGVMLLLFMVAPKDELVRLHIMEMNAHVQSYHPYYVWALTGLLSAAIGLYQLLLRLFRWFFHCIPKNNS